MTHIHFIGIGGSGLSAIARVLLERGYRVSGSDRQHSPLTDRLQAAGAQVYIGHDAAHVKGADVVLRSSAVPDDNQEVQAALQAGIPVLKRGDYLPELLQDRSVIAVAGSHGKTTTTAMIVWLLSSLGQNPGFIAGGEINNLDSNASNGSAPYFVIEADEYDYMFWGLSPYLAVVTNIEHDHPDCFPTPQHFFQAFAGFIERICPDGTLITCLDDPGSAQLLLHARNKGIPALSYSLEHTKADYYADKLQPQAGAGFHFTLNHQRQPLLECMLQVPGRHNVLNALAALAVIDQLGLDAQQAAAALLEFRGAGRRFQVLGHAQGVTVIDDYGHHPSQIRSTLEAASYCYPDSRLWAVWQPHTYSRTLLMLDDFGACFSSADQVLVTDVYAARETQPDGFSQEQVAAAIRHANARYSGGLEQTAALLLQQLQPADVVIIFSAGDATRVSAALLAGLQSKEEQHA